MIEYITGIGLLALPQAVPRRVPEEPVEFRRNVWLRIERGRIAEISHDNAPSPVEANRTSQFDAGGGLVTPGFVDCHTHPVFVDYRDGEFVRRCRGESYLQIAAAGGGILSSVRGVREAELSALTQLVRRRFDRFLELGVTSIEAKSGYGLSCPAELKSLEAVRLAAGEHPLEVSPTLLAAHVVPPEYRHNPDAWVTVICEELIPEVKRRGLADAVDVFLEEGAYNLQQARRIFKVGADAGMRLRLHADQFTAGGGAELAAEFKALTADHMDRTTPEGWARLADAGVTVTLLPGAVFFLGLDQYAPAQRMIQAGVRAALSTDYNPGSSPTQSLPLMMTIAGVKMGLTPEQALWAATLGGAFGLGRENAVGALWPGYQADLCVWEAASLAAIPYRYGDSVPAAVIKRGEVVAERGRRI